MRIRRHRAPSIVVLVVAILTAGCGGGGAASVRSPPGGATAEVRSNAIDMSIAERTARSFVAEQTGAAVKSVSCPATAALKVGAGFTCKATGADGSTAAVVMTLKDSRGDVELSPLELLQTASAAKLIAAALSHEYKATVTVRCPDLVSAHKNTTMTCHATHGGVSRAVLVTVKDDQGSLAYRLE